ncbi:amidohydrolase/deacetylase family metallohydrolase [Cryobacterium lactosi]|uniref:Amidohydrolase/deacetylase family metallohydrolase n=1 Tax=Cryobacterium lactosi TaxID=1259202 RepID=A0A4R9C0M1_9MICO|nr:amidohydrolase/deacetylase family metallohydrolase [Cryobacterium lactosi]TFD95158.1 amidohydrolase/deacetylase family metallohydrolase [Cryobacterium lactosi]
MTPPAVPQFDTSIWGGAVMNATTGLPVPATIAIRDGLIAGVFSADHRVEATATIDARGLLVTAGLIDLHAHVFRQSTDLAVDADRIGVDQGVTTIVDAGSTGAVDFADFRAHVIEPAATRVYSFINISDTGLTAGRTELSRMEDVGTPALHRLLGQEAHRSIRGIKARMSASVVGANGIEPLRVARRFASEFSLPVMVHVGTEPPVYADVLDLLVEGDVVSHAFHGKRGGLFGGGSRIDPAALRARDRGVLFDVGHGSASFSFETLERALVAGFAPDLASTDLHTENVDGPVHSLVTTLNKLLAVGLPLDLVLGYATANAAAVLGESATLGSVQIGKVADISLLHVGDGSAELTDSQGATRRAGLTLAARGAIRAGVLQRQGAIL